MSNEFAKGKAAGKVWAMTRAMTDAFDRMRSEMKLGTGSDEAVIRKFLTTGTGKNDRAWMRLAWLADVPTKNCQQEDVFLSECGSYRPGKSTYGLVLGFWRDALGDAPEIPHTLTEEFIVGFACGAIGYAKSAQC